MNNLLTISIKNSTKMDFASTNSKYQVRSISLPVRSHPSTLKIEEQLTRIQSCCASSSLSSVLDGQLSPLRGVYISLDDLLHMPSTHQLFSLNRHHKCMDQVLEGSMEMLDVCEILRDAVLQIKEQVQALQSALRRRRNASLSDDAAVLDYNRFRKKIRKENIVKVESLLKQMGNKSLHPQPLLASQDHHLVAVIRVLREVNVLSISAFQSLSSFLSEPRPTRWSSAISRWVQIKGLESPEAVVGANANELESVESSLRCLCKLHHPSHEVGKMHRTVQKQLEELDMSIGDIEEALNGIFRWMIKSRASLLNIISE